MCCWGCVSLTLSTFPPYVFDTFTPCGWTFYPLCLTLLPPTIWHITPLSNISKTPKMKSESDWNEKWSNQNDTHKQLMNQFFTHLRSWTSEYTILNMGLPVEEIMAEVEEELMNMNEEELHMDGEVHEDGRSWMRTRRRTWMASSWRWSRVTRKAQDGWLWTLSTFATNNKCS